DNKVNEYDVRQVTKVPGKDNNKKKKAYFDKTYSENAGEGPVETDGFGESWNSKGMGCLINMRSLTLEKQVEIAKVENPFDNVYKNPNTIVNGEDPKDLDHKFYRA
ncbi:45387_t:CDS:2, partial [Gigaspora margarita]